MKNKFILSLMFGVLVLSVFSVGFVSAGLFKKFTITGNAIGSNGWTNWYDRDNPGGSGDWETRSSFDIDCENPTAIECQTTDGRTITETGQNVVCDLDTGLVCLNRENGGSSFFGTTCKDYRVRFYCGGSEVEESTCDGGDCTLIEGSSAVAELNVTSYTLELVYISATEVKVSVDGESTNSLGTNESQILGGVAKVTIKEILYSSKDTVPSKVVLKVERIPTVCGDGIIGIGEGCDDGNTNSGDGCSATCVNESSCGNGIQDIGEQCDGHDWAKPLTCEKLLGAGYTGTLACTSSCTFDTSGCVASEVTYQGVLDMLSNCGSQRDSIFNTSSEITGKDICENIGQKCLMTFEAGHYKTIQGISVKMEDFPVSGIGEDCDYRWMMSSAAASEGADHLSIQAICCSVP